MPEAIRAVRPVGDRAILVELDGLGSVLRLQAALLAHPLDGQQDVLAAAETVLITAESASAARRFAGAVRELDLDAVSARDDALVVIETSYDGEDLERVASLTGLSPDAVVASHTGQLWEAAFGGFAPGFAYLTGENGSLEVPRRDSPRSSVPAGSVALAGPYSAIYPNATPGGWQLIGRTAARVWDIERTPPALIRPGNRVRFRAVRELVVAASGPSGSRSNARTADRSAAETGGGLVVVSAGAQTTVQDLGRPGYGDLNVTASGALDRAALRRANRIAGNPANAAVLENALGGLVLEAETDQVVAVTGAAVPLTVVDPAEGERSVATEAPFALLGGETLILGAPRWGVRSYVALRGGIDAHPALGSRSTDTMSGIGPAPLSAGARIRVFPPRLGSVVGNPEPAPPPPPEVTEFGYLPGPRSEWFTAESLRRFDGQLWTVSMQSNRIGLRLEGTPLERAVPGELPSEGVVAGSLQIPASGLPVLFLADHPVTGGYPVLGVVPSDELDKAAQLAPGAQVRFRAREL